MTKLVKSVFTLTFFTLIERVIGFLFKIYLSRELGATALGSYQVALTFLFVLLALSSSGIPLIIGKLTASYGVTNRNSDAYGLVTSGLIFNIVSSIVVCILVLFFQDFLGLIMTSSESMYVLLVFLPALIFGGIASAFRGNLWGNEKYFAVSFIELIEQIVRIVLCFVLIFAGINNLTAAAVSLVIATFVNSVLCFIFYMKNGGRLTSPSGHFKVLIKSSAPITGLKAVSSLINSALAIIVPLLFVSSGLTESEALASFGASIGMAFPLLFLPVTVVGALAYTLIPTLSKASAQGKKDEVKRTVETAIKFSIVMSAIFIPLFYALGEPIGEFLFLNTEAGQFLKYGGFLLIPISLESIVSSMMNSLNLEFKGFINSLIGSAVMFGIMMCFYGNFTIEVLFISLLASLVVSTILDIACIKKQTNISLSFVLNIACCVGVAQPCIFVGYWLYVLFGNMSEFFRIAIAGSTATMMFVLLSGIFGLIKVSTLIKRKKIKKDKCAKIKQKDLPKSRAS